MQKHYFEDQGPYSQSCYFSSGCDTWIVKKSEHRRTDAFKLWCLRKLWGGPLNAKWSSQSILKKINPEYSLEGLMLETEASILWPPDENSLLIGKDPYAGKDWTQEEEGMTEDEMVGWHHWLNGHEFEQTLADAKDREDWCAVAHRVVKNQTQLRDWRDKYRH